MADVSNKLTQPLAESAFPLTFNVLRHRLVLDNPAFLEVAQQALGHHTLGAPTMTVRVRQGEVTCHDASTVSVQTMQGALPLAVRGNEWALCGGRVRGCFGVSENELDFPLVPTPAELVAQHVALYEAGRVSGLLPLHAAVLSRQGRGVAILGDSGAGKSTAALRLLEQGWHLVAEDSAWLCVETGQVAGARNGLRIRPESLERFAPHWLAHKLPLDVQGKVVLPVKNSESVTLDHLYLIAPVAEPLTAATTLGYWWAATGPPVTPMARQTVARQLGVASRHFALEPIDRDALIQTLA